MFNVPSFFGFKAGGEFDPTFLANAFFARVDAATGVPNYLTSTEQSAITTLILDLNNYGLLNKMKAIYPMVGGGNGTLAENQAACEQNLISSSFTGSFTSGWTFASTGVTPNGTSAYMDTGFLPSASFTNNNTHISAYSRTDATSQQCLIGAAKNPSAIPLITIYGRNATNRYNFDSYDYTDNRISVSSSISSAAFFLNTRTSSTSFKVFRNGSQFGSTNTVANTDDITTCDKEIYLGALNLDGSAAQFNNYQNAFASIGNGLTDTEASDFYTAVQAFQTTLSRQV
jgi:hypothetical protein